MSAMNGSVQHQNAHLTRILGVSENGPIPKARAQNRVNLDPAAIVVDRMEKHQTTVSTFQFKRATADLIQVFNEDSYLMAEYSERTGAVSWQRVLLATQREAVEKWLQERYPVSTPDLKRPSSDRRARILSQAANMRRRRSAGHRANFTGSSSRTK